MSRTLTSKPQNESEPAWDVARIFPDQGQWAEGDYLDLTHSTNHLVEFSDGRVEILPMPKMSHQLIVQYLSNLLLAFASSAKLGRVLFAPLRVRLPQGTYREPDIVFMLAEHADRMGEEYWDGADLVMEVVSEDNREHDLVTKRQEYATAGIPEYWIVDPREQRITILKLDGDRYSIHGEFSPGQRAFSSVITRFEVDVNATFEAGKSR